MATDASQEVFSDAPSEITIEGVAYAISPVHQGNACKAIRWMKSRDMEFFLEKTRMIPLPSEDRALTLAKISCTAPTYLDVLNDTEAKAYLLSLELTADGKAVEFPRILDIVGGLKPTTYAALFDILMVISARRADVSAVTDPLGQTASTSTTTTKTVP